MSLISGRRIVLQYKVVIIISKYSNKCDLYDVLVDIREITDFSKVKIYAANNSIVPLRIDSQKDLMPYYPYIVAISISNSDGTQIIHLSEGSYVDIEEQERLTWDLDTLKRYYRRQKRRHEPFDSDEALKKICFFDSTPEYYKKELVNRVKELGEKATIEDIHIPFMDTMRQWLYEDMVAAGWNDDRAYEWCFGWRRLWERTKTKLASSSEDNNASS